MSSASNIRSDATVSKIKKAFRDNLCCGLDGVAAERVMAVAGPSARNPTANHRIELMRLDAHNP